MVADAGELAEAGVVGLQRRVDGVERQIEEPRLGLVPLDERHRLASEGVREVLLLVGRLLAAEDAGRAEVIVRAAQEAEELVKPAPLRVEFGRRAEMPFADQPGRIPGRLQAIGQRRLGQGQTLAPAAGIELVPEPRLVPAGQQTGAGR